MRNVNEKRKVKNKNAALGTSVSCILYFINN